MKQKIRYDHKHGHPYQTLDDLPTKQQKEITNIISNSITLLMQRMIFTEQLEELTRFFEPIGMYCRSEDEIIRA